ncbi:MAG TPA: hypothetical protein VJ781_06535, partial [Pyrinomonadaceae bacterium]|nr:hypothetical protein [Pyrinomonadaceae bacterium]
MKPFCAKLLSTILRVSIVLLFFAICAQVGAQTQPVVFTVTVLYQGQPAPYAAALVEIRDNRTGGREYRAVAMNALGTYTSVATFQCADSSFFTFLVRGI